MLPHPADTHACEVNTPAPAPAPPYAFDAPSLTNELLQDILSGRATTAPEIEAALRAAEITGQYVCPYCKGTTDGIPRVRSCGMGVESIALLLELLYNPGSRDFCLCQMVNVTMQTGDEHREDTISNMETYILPLYRYFRLRFVELARGGEFEKDGIVILQDTAEPYRLHPDGYYKLSDHLLLNGTVPQAGGEHRCSMHYKGFCCEYWLQYCFQMNGVYHIFGYNADESERAARSDDGIAARNAKLLERCKVSPPAAKKGQTKKRPRRRKHAPRVRLRVAGDRFENYELAEVRIDLEGAGGDPPAEGRVLRYVTAFGFNSDETDRAARASEYDGLGEFSYAYERDESSLAMRAIAYDRLERRGLYLLVRWRWTRPICWQSIYDRLGINWKKSCCVECPFDKEASNCTAKGVERKKLHPELTARSLLLEYASTCLNERGLLYVRKSLQAVVLKTEQLEALEVFEQMLAGMQHSLFEVKRIYTAKGKAGRSVIKLATGSREEMSTLFGGYATDLRLKVKVVNGISYAVFAERGEEYPAVEGFLVVAPAKIGQKVQGKFSKFEERFARVARARGIILPALPGGHAIREYEPQGNLFSLAA